jgi:hypothetical protein
MLPSRSSIPFVIEANPATGRPKHVTTYETGQEAQLRLASGMQAIFASKLKGKPAKAKKDKK